MSDIADWLSRVGLGQYTDAFQSNGVDLGLLKTLTNEDLKDIGVGRLADRKRLLEEIARLASPGPDFSGNRRLLTVLFSDVVGSTELSTRLDPEDLRAALRRYQEMAHASIAKFGGVIANDLGDGIMAYFGWPNADEDQARQAVRAGFDVIRAIGQKEPGQDIELRCRVGIATGRVVVGGDKKLDSAFGETPNLAARLQSLADENSIVIDRTTRHMLGPAFPTAALGAFALKGFQNPIDVWQVTAEQKYLDRFDSHHEGASKFVGRRDELGWLMLGWRNLDQGRGRTAVIRGEAGMGKSRLVREFEHMLRQENAQVLRFQCSPNHVNSAFHPVIQNIEAGAGFEPHGEPPAARRAKLSLLFADAIAEEPRLIFLLLDLLAIPHEGAEAVAALTPAARRQLLIKALIGNTVRVSRAAPVLVVLEDAHWIDPSSLEMLQRLSERADEERIFVLVTTRPGRELQLAGAATELGLGRLSDTDVATLAKSILGDTKLNEQELTSIVRRVEGVPLFAEELTSTLAERKADGHLDLPENIQASITARLDALGPDRQAAQVASVIGRDFSYAQLVALAGGTVAELEKALAELVRSGLVLVRDARDRTYVFKHALVRDVAYESLLHEPRRHLHLHFAHGVLVDEDKERVPELVAHHLTEGGAVLEALEYWRKAGYRASRASANIEAIAHFSKGLSLIGLLNDTDGRERLELAFQVGLMGPLITMRGYTDEELRTRIARALELSRKVTDAPEIFPVLFGRWSSQMAGGLIDKSLETAKEFADLAERQNNSDALFARHRMLGGSRLFLGDLDEAEQDLDRLVAIYKSEEHERLLTAYGADFRVAAHCFRSGVYWLKGRSRRARESVEIALQHARRIGHVHTLGMSLFFGALISLFRQDRKGVCTHMEEMMALASRQAIGAWPVTGRSMLGWVQIVDGELEPGLALMREGLDASQKLGVPLFVPILKCLSAEILLSHRRLEEAGTAIRDAESIIAMSERHYFSAEVLRLRAEHHFHSGSSDLAEADLHTAMALARHQNAKALELRAAISYSRFSAAQGVFSRARDVLMEAANGVEAEEGNPDLMSAHTLLETLPRR